MMSAPDSLKAQHGRHDQAADLTRRDLLRLGGAACVAAGTARFLGCAPPCEPAEPDPAPTDVAARVAVIRGTDLADMARAALAAFGGAVAIVNPGETVFIKPNFGSLGMVKYNPIPRGESVRPEIVIAVAEECLKAGGRS